MSDQEDKSAPAEATEAVAAAESAEPTLTASQVKAMLAAAEQRYEQKLAALKPKAEPEKELTAHAQMKAQVAEMIAEREAEKASARELQLQSSLKDELGAGNVPPHMMKAAIATLVHADKLVGYNDDGQLVFKGKYGDEDLVSGLKGWLKSEDGKAFQAPKGVTGSGDRAYRAGNPTNTQSKPDAVDLLIGAWQRGEI